MASLIPHVLFVLMCTLFILYKIGSCLFPLRKLETWKRLGRGLLGILSWMFLLKKEKVVGWVETPLADVATGNPELGKIETHVDIDCDQESVNTIVN